MLYVAYVRNRAQGMQDSESLRQRFQEKGRAWWNEAKRPAGLKTLSFHAPIGSAAPGVMILDAESPDDLRQLVEFWNEVEFDIHPALDKLDEFRRQGMDVPGA